MIELQEALKRVAIIGAAGKMGSGIALILLQTMAVQEAISHGSVGEKGYRLILVDTHDQMLDQLQQYLRRQLIKFAEKQINSLRKWFAFNPQVVDNEQMVNAFVEGAFKNIRVGSSLEMIKESLLVFEAINENVASKVHVFSKLKDICPLETLFFSNTSSIPISLLSEKSQLADRLIGYHFYNPPPIQKLLEIIIPQNRDSQFVSLATELGKRLDKILVFSKDVAGFIGNGFFIREIAFTMKKVKQLSTLMPQISAIYLLNEVTQEYLVRPMGIFQLIDYVGIDVCHSIMGIMQTYIPGLSIDQSLVKEMIAKKVLGGQQNSGMQKDGFFHYENNVPTAIFDRENEKYISLSVMKVQSQKMLGELPKEHYTWKMLSKDKQKEQKLKTYFATLFKESTLGAELAKEYLLESQKIAEGLVKEGAAHNIGDVKIVLENGFFHLYGPELALSFKHK